MSKGELSRQLEPQKNGKPVSEDQIARWERGTTEIPAGRVFELARIFGLRNPEYLLGLDDQPKRKLRRVK